MSNSGNVRHVLLFSLKDEIDEELISSLRESFLSLPERIEGIESIEWGLNNSVEGLNRNLDYAVLMTFINIASRDAYIPHPEHERLKLEFVPLIKDIVVFDYAV